MKSLAVGIVTATFVVCDFLADAWDMTTAHNWAQWSTISLIALFTITVVGEDKP